MADSVSTFTRGTGTPTGFVGIELKSSPLPGIKAALEELKYRTFRKLMKEIGEYWHREIMPKHFRPGNWQRYNIAPRTEKYMTGKKRRYGIGVGKHVAGIYRGETLRRLTHQKTITVAPHATHVTVAMNAPTYFTNPYDPRGTQPDQVKELLQVNAEDLAELHNFAYRRLYEMSAEGFANVKSRAA